MPAHSGDQTELHLGELTGHVAKAGVLVSLYEKHANTESRNVAELEAAKRELRVIKQEILAELLQSSSALHRLQREVKP